MTIFGINVAEKVGNQNILYNILYYKYMPRAGSGAVSKWVICACDSLVDYGAV